MKLLVLVLLQLSLLAPSSASQPPNPQEVHNTMLLVVDVLKGDLLSWRITDVVYNTDGINVISHSPEAMRKSTVSNHECQQVAKKVTLEKEFQVDQRWDTGESTTTTVGGSITATFPFVSASVSFGTETTKQFTQGTTLSETVTHSVTVEQNVPPNHMCSATMVAYKYEAKIPFTAVKEYVSRTRVYRFKITGTYESIQVGEVRAVVDRCEPIPNARPCP